MRLGFAGILMAVLLSGPGLADSIPVQSLAGDWSFRLDPDGKGVEGQWQSASFEETVRLPGSLDENGKGTPNTAASRAYLSRLFEYIGAAWYQREVEIPAEWTGKSLEVFLERCHWETRLWIDDRLVGVQDSLCAPHVFALGALTPGKHRFTLRIDNNIKYDVGSRAHSITEHTQTNWNGVIGRMELRALEPVRIASVQVYPNASNRTAAVRVLVDNTLDKPVVCRVNVSALGTDQSTDVSIAKNGQGTAELTLE
ncbi:MAG: sugar-binding domain-containing protein, partial [Candidatus Hydrogenedentales bacterium]